MYYYKTDDNRAGRRAGVIATILYLVLLAALMLLIKFTVEKPVEDYGIMINFGDGEDGFGTEDTPMIDIESNPANSFSPQQPDEILTQNYEEAPQVKVNNPKPQPQVERPSVTPSQQPTQTPPQERPREVNRQALFPGRTAGSTSTSEGRGTGTGNQGDPNGAPDGSHDGTGSGTSGVSHTLRGRDFTGAVAKPDYNANEGGKVVVDIRVDKAGNVVSASFLLRGSTTQNSTLVNAAIRAAKKTKFTSSETEDLQAGTITYNFKLK